MDQSFANTNVIGFERVNQERLDAAGSVVRYKTRLVAKLYTIEWSRLQQNVCLSTTFYYFEVVSDRKTT